MWMIHWADQWFNTTYGHMDSPAAHFQVFVDELFLLQTSTCIRPTNLALSFWCLNRTRPDLSSAQVKVSSLVSSLPNFPLSPLSPPSSPLKRTSRPLLGPWTSWKISVSDGLSGSFTCSRVGGNGAKPPRGTSKEPLTWRAGGWVFTKRRREDRKKLKNGNGQREYFSQSQR